MGIVKLKDGIYSVGVLNPNLRVFDIIMETKYGTSYNAYLVCGKEKTALIETVHEKFFDEYLENISQVTDPKKIDYVILNHTEPDHSGSLRKLLDVCPDIKIVASFAGAKCLKAITNTDIDPVIAKDDLTIDLGGKVLKFIIAPLLHWPDSMFTYIEEDQILFPCDFLGAHYCEPRMIDKYMLYKENYDYSFKYYYDCIFGPFKQAVLDGLGKIRDLKIDMVAPSHGPVLVERIQQNMDLYRQWSETILHKNNPKKVAIIYVSAYRCTEMLAEAAYDELIKAGFDAKLYNLVDNPVDVKPIIEEADAFMLGSPTINRDALKPIWDAISVTDAIINKGKPVGVFGSYGWSGEAVPMLVERLKALKLKPLEPGFRANLVPSNDELDKMRQYTREFIKTIS